MLDKLKRAGVDNVELEDLIELSSFGSAFANECSKFCYEPEWLASRMKSIGREIKSRLADTVEKELAQAQAQLAAMTPAEDKRKQLAEKIAALAAKLGQ